MHEEYSDDLSSIDVFPEGKIFRLAYDHVVGTLRIIARNRDWLEELRKAFSVENNSAFFSQQYGYKSEARLYNINQFGYFMPGLVYKILEWIRTQYGSLQCVAVSTRCKKYISDTLRPLSGVKPFEIDNMSDSLGRNAEIRDSIKSLVASGKPESEINIREFKLRKYQKEAIEALLFKGKGRGLIEIPTAGGKSYILGNFIWNLFKNVDKNYKVMILVPNVQLVEQFCGDLEDYGFDRRSLAKFEGGMSKKEKLQNDVSTAKIIIANRQYVFKNEGLLPKIDVLICDEVHQCCAEKSMEWIMKCQAKVKVGCSGTIPSDQYRRNQLIGMFGDVVYQEEITKLQSMGFVSKLKVTVLNIVDREVEKNRDLLFHVNSTKKYVADDPYGCDIRFDDAVRAEHDYFAKWYKTLYKPAIDYAAKLDGNTLVLFDRIDIGTNIYEYFKELYPERTAFYNDGSTKVNEREETRSELEKSSGNILFANVQVCGTGISIKRLHNIIFCFSTKSTVRVIQSIGRILRLYSGKDCANLIDTVFNFKYSQRHYRERLNMYKKYYGKKPDDFKTILL